MSVIGDLNSPLLLAERRLPAALRALDPAPARVFLAGSLPPPPRVAMVGTRHPTPDAVGFTLRLARDLARRGVAVVSGGAVGIDAAAHRGALEQGQTLLVAPSGLGRPSPVEHAALYRQIVEAGGGCISEYDHKTVARRHHFLRRNALIAALSEIVVVVQAPFRSGARNAAAWARRLGCALMAVPASPWEKGGMGGNLELALGARLCVGVSDVMRVLEERACRPVGASSTETSQLELPTPGATPLQPSRVSNAVTVSRPLGAEERPWIAAAEPAVLQRVLDALGPTPQYPDQLGARVGLGGVELQRAITELSLRGRIRVFPGGSVIRLL